MTITKDDIKHIAALAMIYLDAEEIEKYQNTIYHLRNEVETSRKEKAKIIDELRFLKDSGEEILVLLKILIMMSMNINQLRKNY